MKLYRLTIAVGCLGLASMGITQSVLFNFDGGPQFTGTPLDQVSGGIRAHFTGTGSGYSIQNTDQVIGMLPLGFQGLGLSPNSVFGSDLGISFSRQSDGTAQNLSSVSILVAPQELACDSSSTMKITAYKGATVVGSQQAIAPNLDTYTWPTITLSFTSGQVFDNVVVHFQSGPPTGGDWGGIFVADNLSATAVPEPASVTALVIGGLALLRRRAQHRQ